ncbi:MAG: hypothetical protein WCV86_02685 [Patescibacteria group bacterium]|jgi:hypothetical protein
MRINELLLVDPESNCTQPTVPVPEGKNHYAFQVAIIRQDDGSYTWRGQSQYLPKGVLMGFALIHFVGDDDEKDEIPLDINPVAVEMLGIHGATFRGWTWDNHYVDWAVSNMGRVFAAQFSHLA